MVYSLPAIAFTQSIIVPALLLPQSSLQAKAALRSICVPWPADWHSLKTTVLVKLRQRVFNEIPVEACAEKLIIPIDKKTNIIFLIENPIPFQFLWDEFPMQRNDNFKNHTYNKHSKFKFMIFLSFHLATGDNLI